MEKVYSRPKSMTERPTSYCPGCLHGVVTKLIAEIVDELEISDDTVGVLPVGCSTLGLFHFNLEAISAAHGRAPAIATGFKRCAPDKVVFTYQGDGDLASIGMAEIMHCANRGENVTTIFVNNSIYGMTGGQMAPTTLVGQKATTCLTGRNPEDAGFPMKMCEIISQLDAPVYVARFSLDSPANILKAKKGMKKAFELQMEGKGYTFIELLSNCPTNWGMTAEDSIQWMRDNTMKEFPLGEFKVPEECE
ncbi:2-oxoglutarate ferredoxin oxidoreductase subunit beta [Dethiosulfatibacter aminovorans DSM 17477]|uniref:2-oxoglutarate ferredoxin oxidoreductase subunit beta n=1 Tax=Dethiosulfatibacter aminovorans DSM 17477 TaxID=1121476 RepID=A0A1M6EIZ6_9FIRM|nr:thiamine pyrophosphate-dependent enzyme [Dethiosulfatibacter aminovorans]SHI85423.1 2-oxoglutarate ferredoxin oxidoreductase subunit beta [Dethiosulfatibacter aminovorans DSM 17477]